MVVYVVYIVYRRNYSIQPKELLSLREMIKQITMKSKRKYNLGKGGLRKQLLLTKST